MKAPALLTAALLLFVSIAFANSSDVTPAQRAASLLARMTLADKIGLMHGVSSPGYTGATAPNPALSIPALLLNDGRQGFRPNDGAHTQTAFPCELAAVATFDTDLMYEFGAAMGAEFKGKGANVVLAPMLILTRVPNDGRSFESIGEDPELAYAMAKAHVSGVQSVPGVIANADDFVLNNQETDRSGISAVCDRRTLFEMYYRGYAGAIDGGVGSFMCSYNLINGTHACENNVTLGDLKNPQGLNFTGFVLSDWGGVHSTVPSALAGLDQEMPGSTYFGPALYAAVEQGLVSNATIDDKAMRILTVMFAQGVMDAPPCPSCTQDANVTSPDHTALARTIGAASTVLLKNDGNILPLKPAVASIAVIGNDCDASPDCCGAGSGGLDPPYIISPLQGVLERAGPGVNVTYYPSPSGLTQFYSASRGDHFLDFTCEECMDLYVTLRVEGYAYPASTSAASAPGLVELSLYYNVATSSNLVAGPGYSPPAGYSYIRPLAYALPLNSSAPNTAVLELWSGHDTPTGQPKNSHLDFFTLATNESRAEAIAAGYTKVMDIARVAVVGSDYASIAAAAAAADVAIICVSTPSSEGMDRPNLNLTQSDEQLIAAVGQAQPSTIVTMNNPGAVVMPWADSVAAILAAWYPGQEMGHALADVLFGDVNPSGRLPVTFAMVNEDTPMTSPSQYPGVDGTVIYSEKLEFGYRWWDAAGVTPRFPFGHGLSYTNFTYSGLSIAGTTVSFTVTNTGGVPGREAPQLYVSFPPSAGEPPQVLRGFTRTQLLAVGQSVQISFTLTSRDLSVWSTDAYAWAPVEGKFGISVGSSSRDIRLRGSIVV